MPMRHFETSSEKAVILTGKTVPTLAQLNRRMNRDRKRIARLAQINTRRLAGTPSL